MEVNKLEIDILIIGGNSKIGEALINSYRSENYKLAYTTRDFEKLSSNIFYLDLENDDVEKYINNIFPKKVFFCAAITSMIDCSKRPIFSYKINVTNTFILIKHFIKKGSFVVFLSTGAVFNGETPFSTIDEVVKPQTEYGKQKVEIEKLINTLMPSQWAIIRLSKVISTEFQLIHKWINILRKEEKISPYNDIVFSPISIELVVSVIKKIANDKIFGFFHISANKDISYYDLALFIAQKAAINKKLIANNGHTNEEILWIPKNTTLDCNSIESLGYSSPSPYMAFEQIFKLFKIN